MQSINNSKISVMLIMVSVMLLFSQSVFAKRQPAMENSLRALDNAERILKKALPNKGGHRVRALRLIQKAKIEIRKGIDFANRRGAGGQLKKRTGKHDESRDDYRNKQRYNERDEEERVIKKRY